MSQSPLKGLDVFQAWQRQRLGLLEKLHGWLRQQGLLTPEADATLGNAERILRREHITIAVVGEYSRGKTELINALFFTDYGCRLLPSNPGRTTMCPTEIFYDPDRSPFIRLLPIETRLDERSLGEFYDDNDAWVFETLDTTAPQAMAEQCMALSETIRVPRADASAYGVVVDEDREIIDVDVPRWRMAQINLHHPVLESGLRILDTPGLNAIGTEPELTYQILPTAHAVVFVLAADTGVTRTDLEIWQEIARPLEGHGPNQTIVVLNKTDTLWDELSSSSEIAGNIIQQCQNSARQLDVSPNRVFATSAQKALQARICGDEALWHRTGISSLQRHLSEAIAANKRQILQQSNARMVLETINMIDGLIDARIEQNRRQQRQLQSLANDSDEVVRNRLAATQQKYSRYQQDIEAYTRIINDFHRRSRNALSALSPGLLDITLDDIRRRMSEAWTTVGLKRAMHHLVSELESSIGQAADEIRTMRQQLRAVEERFAADGADLPNEPIPMLSMVHHQVELRLLVEEAESFRRSARAALMEQHFVVNHYFSTIAARAKDIIQTAYDEVRHWSATAVAPFEETTRSYREALAEEIAQLQQTGRSRRTVYKRISVLKHEVDRLNAQTATLQNVRDALMEQAADTADISSRSADSAMIAGTAPVVLAEHRLRPSGL